LFGQLPTTPSQRMRKVARTAPALARSVLLARRGTVSTQVNDLTSLGQGPAHTPRDGRVAVPLEREPDVARAPDAAAIIDRYVVGLQFRPVPFSLLGDTVGKVVWPPGRRSRPSVTRPSIQSVADSESDFPNSVLGGGFVLLRRDG